MKVVLFCGGKGTRIREASELMPKPLIRVCNLPIILRLMARYSESGVNQFILATGYLGEKIERYFENLSKSSPENTVIDQFLMKKYGSKSISNWDIKIVDTGDCNIGTRLFKVKEFLKDDEYFFANYSDSVSSINIKKSLSITKGTNKIAAIAAVKQSSYYHWLDYDAQEGNRTKGFEVKKIESSKKLSHRINGGYMCLSSQIFDFLNYGEELVEEPFKRLTVNHKLICYETDQYWRSIDTYKDLLDAEKEIKKMGYDFIH